MVILQFGLNELCVCVLCFLQSCYSVLLGSRCPCNIYGATQIHRVQRRYFVVSEYYFTQLYLLAVRLPQ